MARVKKGTEEAAAAKKTTSRAKKTSSASGAAAAAAPAKERVLESPSPAAVGNVASIEDEIRRRAYELYLERNGQGGSPADDWARAEAEIREKRSA